MFLINRTQSGNAITHALFSFVRSHSCFTLVTVKMWVKTTSTKWDYVEIFAIAISIMCDFRYWLSALVSKFCYSLLWHLWQHSIICKPKQVFSYGLRTAVRMIFIVSGVVLRFCHQLFRVVFGMCATSRTELLCTNEFVANIEKNFDPQSNG